MRVGTLKPMAVAVAIAAVSLVGISVPTSAQQQDQQHQQQERLSQQQQQQLINQHQQRLEQYRRDHCCPVKKSRNRGKALYGADLRGVSGAGDIIFDGLAFAAPSSLSVGACR